MRVPISPARIVQCHVQFILYIMHIGNITSGSDRWKKEIGDAGPDNRKTIVI